MSSKDPKEQEATPRQGGNVETKGAFKNPPSGGSVDESKSEGQPAPGEADKKD